MAKYNAYYKSDASSTPSLLGSTKNFDEAVQLCCKRVGSSHSQMVEEALYERGYYTISYGPSQVYVEEVPST